MDDVRISIQLTPIDKLTLAERNWLYTGFRPDAFDATLFLANPVRRYVATGAAPGCGCRLGTGPFSMTIGRLFKTRPCDA